MFALRNSLLLLGRRIWPMELPFGFAVVTAARFGRLQEVDCVRGATRVAGAPHQDLQQKGSQRMECRGHVHTVFGAACCSVAPRLLQERRVGSILRRAFEYATAGRILNAF